MYNSYINHAKGRNYSILFDMVLTPMSLFTGAFIACSDFLRSHGIIHTDSPVLPVISVGNLTYGGTNKTPFTIMLAEYAHSKGINTGIVTRGYMGKAQDVEIILNGEGELDITGDEALMISRKLPHIPVAVSKRRIDGVNALRDLGVELVIADDAFQHKSMSRDCDIVLIDALCPFGNGRLAPSGIMRENIKALKRAHIAVITKSSMAAPHQLNSVYQAVSSLVPPEKIFMSDIAADGWLINSPDDGADVFAFSATGSPETFTRSLQERDCRVAGSIAFRDHHRYTHDDIIRLNNLAVNSGASFMACTEKDLANMPGISENEFALPLAVPKVKVIVRDFTRFTDELSRVLRPEIVIASNGYGEDAIASVLAVKMKNTYPLANVSAFPLVGNGEAFKKAGVNVLSAKSVTPSAGVFKYSLRELWGDIKAGLLHQVREQLNDWRNVSRRILTPICTGDVYLLLNTLWGAGKRPLFIATAKTVNISGHWRTERALIRAFTLKTWTRDEPTAAQIGGNASYSGSPIMDLLGGNSAEKGNVILLLPGSRKSAVNDVKILLGAVEIIFSHGHKDFRMVLAPTLDYDKFFAACASIGWENSSGCLKKNNISISLTNDEISKAARNALILIGMGGTANQLCAGLGIPVIAPDNKGKRVQKKLLGNSEILTQNSPGALAECTLRVLDDKGLYDFMSAEGRKRMGVKGACDNVILFTRDVLGWGFREKVYSKLISADFNIL